MSTPKKFTRAEVESHVESLNHLLKDVGPEISKALTQLVLNKPAASKQEALEFLATHLAASSAPVRLCADGTLATYGRYLRMPAESDRYSSSGQSSFEHAQPL